MILTALALAILLHAAQVGLFAVVSDVQRGLRYNAGPRDDAPAPLSPRAARLQRATANHAEALILFAPAAILAHLVGHTPVATACAWTYLAARALYVPAYVFPFGLARSALWIVGFTATVAMVISTLI